MCTVVVDRRDDVRVPRILALRDELTSRAFDEPGRWWPDRPTVVGGRDRSAGGSWCVTDVATGNTALVLNRTERRTGSPSRGGLPLAAVSGDAGWVDSTFRETMASFSLLVVTPSSLTGWTWDARDLRRVELEPGLHMATPAGIDACDARTVAHATRFADPDWRKVVAGRGPADDPSALVVRHDVEQGTWATVFGQLIEAVPGRLLLEHSRTPWVAESWTAREWTS